MPCMDDITLLHGDALAILRSRGVISMSNILSNRVKCSYCGYTTPRFTGRGKHVGFRLLRNHLGDAHWEATQALYRQLRQEELAELPEQDPEEYAYGF